MSERYGGNAFCQVTGLSMEVKAGIYRPSADAADIALIMDRAKIACSSIKNTYDLTWAEFDPAMEEEINFRSPLIRSFREAMNEGCIEVFYQPEIGMALSPLAEAAGEEELSATS